MYLYLYDHFLNSKKYLRTLIKIETRLTDLGIGGKISRLSPLKNLKELIKDEINNGVKTVVVVGNDKSVIQVINEVINYDITLGIIPVTSDNKIGAALGINSFKTACDILASRKIERIDIGRANNTYFIAQLTIPTNEVVLDFDKKYQIIPMHKNQWIDIFNLKPAGWEGDVQSSFNPYDGVLEAIIYPAKLMSKLFFKTLISHKNSQNSIIPFKKISILSKKSISVITDSQTILKTPVNVEVLPKKLKVIVGKKRAF